MGSQRRRVLNCLPLVAALAACGDPMQAGSDAGLGDAFVDSGAGAAIDVPMRDGVVLKTWVFAPPSGAAAPFFMVRNPYASLNDLVALVDYARFFTDRGMGLVWQAVRGTGGSQGAFVPYLAEVDDAADTIAWLIAQPYSNGRVGVGGGSYLGYTAFAAAVDPHVVVVLSDDTATDEEMTRHGGAVNGYLLSWWSYVERDHFAADAERAALTNALDPTTADESVLGRDLPYWNALLATDAAIYPPTASLRALAPRICAPALHVLEGDTPWNDPRLAWDAISNQGCAQEKAHQWLVVAPESHSYHFNAFGLATTWLTPDMLTMLEAFLLKEKPAPAWSRVRDRVESEEPTHEVGQWPPAPIASSTFYLGAPDASGEGTLALVAPANSAWMLQSDPAATDPCAQPTDTWFTSAPLVADLVLVGSPALSLQATTTALDFDVHVQLYDYQPSPESYRSLGAAVMRARYRNGAATPLPSGAFSMEIALPAMARRIPAGHALTVAISPSRCEFVENPNTGEPLGEQRSRAAAQVSLALGISGARITLPQRP